MRWIFPGLFSVLLAASWACLFLGVRGVVAWIIISALWPLLGLAVLVTVAITSLVKRRVTATRWVSGLVAVIAAWPLAWSFGVADIAYPSSPSSKPSLTVQSPSAQPLRVVWGGEALAKNHHASSPGQRWAYDLVIEPALTGSKALSDYGCFGTLVLAPTAGVVHMAHDGEADLAIGEALTDPAKLLGNHVVLKVEGGAYLVLAHLQKGSVLVKPGTTVTTGQSLGRCGNSGNSSEPHIHMHLQRQDPMALHGDLNLGVNYVDGLPLFFHSASGPVMPKGGIRVEGDKAIATGDTVLPKPVAE